MMTNKQIETAIKSLQKRLSATDQVMQSGTSSVTLQAKTTTTGSVTFPKAFKDANYVLTLTLQHNSNVTDCFVKIGAKTATGFTYYVMSYGAGTHLINWIAIQE